MKTILIFLLALISVFALAQDKGIKNERLMTKDTNKDGMLSKEELGDQFWKRAASQDANGDGVLDAKEIAAMQTKGRGGKTEQARPGGANAAFQVREFKGTNGETLRYSLFVPEKMSESPLPLVLCLHGSGGNTAAANVLAAPEMQAKHPCLIIAPACDGRSTRWVEGGFRIKDKEVRAVMPELMEMLDAVITEFKADPARVYVTGQSLGGVGSWGLIASHASKFAAAVPVCGFWEPADAPKMNGVV
jgi:poly(3-hydroxybutyrate) depolymerase